MEIPPYTAYGTDWWNQPAPLIDDETVSKVLTIKLPDRIHYFNHCNDDCTQYHRYVMIRKRYTLSTCWIMLIDEFGYKYYSARDDRDKQPITRARLYEIYTDDLHYQDQDESIRCEYTCPLLDELAPIHEVPL